MPVTYCRDCVFCYDQTNGSTDPKALERWANNRYRYLCNRNEPTIDFEGDSVRPTTKVDDSGFCGNGESKGLTCNACGLSAGEHTPPCV